jgi:hypothetical protein
LNHDTLCYRQSLAAYRIRNGDFRPVSELPEDTISNILQGAQRRKIRFNFPALPEGDNMNSPLVAIAKEYDAIAFRLVEHYKELRFERCFLIMLVLEDIFEDDIREIARTNNKLFSLTEEDVTALLERK